VRLVPSKYRWWPSRLVVGTRWLKQVTERI
jgi:hypothetical protein